MKFADKSCKKTPTVEAGAWKLKSACAVLQILVVIRVDGNTNDATGIDIPEINRNKQ